jgi:TRAP-type C4-dicarboxylate transport system permease small subunit
MPNDPARGTAVDSVLRAYLSVSKAAIVVVGVAMLAFMVAVDSLEIVGRGLFGRSFSWVQEGAVLAAMWVYFFAYGLIAKDEEYIRVDFFVNRLGAQAQAVVGVVARLLTIAFHAILFWYAIDTYRFLGLFATPVLDWPESLFILPLLLGAADITITELILLYWHLVGRAPVREPHVLPEAD